jgi:hypothetical protein
LFLSYVFFWHIIVKKIEKKNAKYFFNNYHSNNESVISLAFEANLMNFCLGACHLLFESFYTQQLFVLACIELIYICLRVGSIHKKTVTRIKSFGFQSILTSFLRMLLIFSFLID